MIRHIVFFSARDKADIPAIVSGLSKLGDIPHSRHFEVRLNGKVDPVSYTHLTLPTSDLV